MPSRALKAIHPKLEALQRLGPFSALRRHHIRRRRTILRCALQRQGATAEAMGPSRRRILPIVAQVRVRCAKLWHNPAAIIRNRPGRGGC